jgi:hypothetical protein
MKAVFSNPVAIPSFHTTPEVGWFAITPSVQWYSCREEFAKFFLDNVQGFFYGIKPGNDENIASFLAQIEEIIDLPFFGYEYSTFSKCDKPVCFYIKPSRFWMIDPIRRAFLTAAIRAGEAYDPDKNNFEEALLRDKCGNYTNYLGHTKDATFRFLFGYTKFASETPSVPVSPSLGWSNTFYSKSRDIVRQRLVWPDANKTRPLKAICSVVEDALAG